MKHVLPLIGLLALTSSFARAGQAELLELWNETVCYVNNERIAKRDVERAIDPMVMGRLFEFRHRMKQAGKWDEKTQRQYHELLMPDFRRELRQLVRQKLMLQEAKESEIQIDKVEYQKRLEHRLKALRQYGVLGKPGFTMPEIQEQTRKQLMVKEFSSSLVTAFDMPNKPQVEKYYKEHQAEYMLPPMVKLRIIKIGMDRKKSTAGSMQANSPLSIAENLRKDVVDYGIDFSDLAREKSDDKETRSRGGLLLGPDGSEYIDPTQNRLLAPEVRKLSTGSLSERTSQVFRMDEHWALVFLEEQRPAGPAPLDTKLYEKISEKLIEQVVKRKQKEWFAEALKRSLVLDGSPTPKPIPLTFFFPEDPVFGRELQEAAKKEAKNLSHRK